ncbi:acyl-CoA dehydrogenase family protein [Nocardioides sp. W7]|uniref:acyl-CoA dehydrogenase family protein n=1 Tax=Nocardioides sp. W7 TaxID=2931390 RepID=UPI001FCF9CD9|nr:acyl-CoA dehydrogenase family protein [Nocardioides sp. W7]
MDFALTEDQDAVRDLAARILGDLVTVDRLRQLESGPEWLDRSTWSAMARSHLVDVSLPDGVGGSGLGLLETCLVLEQVGRTLAHVPMLSSIVAGALPVARFGTDAQREQLLPAAARGETILASALEDPDTSITGHDVRTARTATGWRLDGHASRVAGGTFADVLLVPARAEDGAVTVFLVPTDAEGLALAPVRTTNREPEADLVLTGVEVAADAVLGDPGAGDEVVAWARARVVVGLCATQLGVLHRALELMAEYTSEREAFGRPLAHNQAVRQRVADCYIDVEAVRLTLWQAIWALESGGPAESQVAVAKFWCAEAGHRVGHAAVHLHGGVGVDVEHPVHRYFIGAKKNEFTLGNASQQLSAIGALLADESTPIGIEA